ncbi:MAG: FeoB-associated Cys-rich membrane protein [Bacteroidales bacterium]|nr:FeoB-associated Cys-rich membrane protein [Bacteroidales bacterium]
MIQDIITLGIVFSAVAYAAWSLYATLTAGGRSKCDGCTGCALKKELA